MNAENRTCQNCKVEFTIEPDDFVFYEKIDVPPPTFCPECRYIRRLLDRNEYNLYRRKCDATGRMLISIYRPDVPFPVYDQEYWKSDAWDPKSYGRDFDFNRPFFEQYEELRRVVPHLAMVNSNSVNSEYTNQANNNKDSYMLFTSDRCEKGMYGSWCHGGCYFLSDCYMAEKCEFCYECVDVAKCSQCAWLNDCSDCVNVYFSTDCRGCTDCFGCVGLRSKQYYWFNENIGKEEYEKRVKQAIWNREFIREAQEKVAALRVGIPVKFYHGLQAQNSTGDYIENIQRARLAFNCRDNKDTAYMQDAWQKVEDCRDCTEIIISQMCYEIQGVEIPNRTIVARSCFSTISDSCYCDMCFVTNNCFGCFGLQKGEYCILNKQYSKEEYLALKAKIIAHMKQTKEWGEYFPASVSPFSYNESMAQDYFPLTREEALAKGYSWRERPETNYDVTMTSTDLPGTIATTTDDILTQAIRCKTQESAAAKAENPLCATVFRLIPLELTLYRKLGIPVPEYCFQCRRGKRFLVRNPRRLVKRHCQCGGVTASGTAGGKYKNTAEHFHGVGVCPNDFQTSYTFENPAIVYCEQCYQAEVV